MYIPFCHFSVSQSMGHSDRITCSHRLAHKCPLVDATSTLFSISTISRRAAFVHDAKSEPAHPAHYSKLSSERH